MKRHNESNHESSTAAPERPLWSRALLLGLTWTLVLQPSMAAAATTISQLPMFSVDVQPPNVMLLMDDSNSMREYTLPLPPGITPGAPNCKTVATAPSNDGVLVTTRLGSRCRSHSNDWLIRSPALNPLWYNPAITYTPWNDNNKPASTTFPRDNTTKNWAQAPWGGSAAVAAAPLTPWDARYWPTNTTATYSPSTTRVTSNAGTIGSSEQIVAADFGGGPAGKRWIRYPGIPGEGTTGRDLFTGSAFTCNLCNKYDQVPQYGPLPPCKAYEQLPVYGPLPPCKAYEQVPVYGPLPPCLGYVQVPVYGPLPPCKAYEQLPVYGPLPPCKAYEQLPIYGPAPPDVCVYEPDAGEESGFRLVCTPQPAPIIGYKDGKCIDQPPADIIGYKDGKCIDQPPADIIGYVDGACNNQPPADIIGYKDGKCIDQPPADIIGYKDGKCIDQPPADIIGYKDGACLVFNPADDTCPLANRVFGAGFAAARYFKFTGAPGEQGDPTKYTMVDIDRATGASYSVVDARTGAVATRTDCAAGTTCTFTEEAKNFANWYTYYRNRLFAAVAVSSQVLADMTDVKQNFRIGYGRINRFKAAPAPWNPPTGANPDGVRFGGSAPSIDGNSSTSPTAVERGVRSFTVGTSHRQNVFDWLFGLNWVGSTPNREAVYSAGAYFTRSDNQSPYANDPETGDAAANHLWCRRNYTLLATDGEWTQVAPPSVSPKPQPRIEDAAADGFTLDLLSTGANSILNADGVDGVVIQGKNRKTGVPYADYQYKPGVETWLSGGSSSQLNTLTDVAKYFWANDLRPEAYMKNNLDPLTRNEAFWQHMSTFIVGYGVTASMDDAGGATRAAVDTKTGPVPWPDVGLENCRIVDLDAHPVNTTTGGCGVIEPALSTADGNGHRIDDTFRATLASKGNFYSAASPEQLRASLKTAFEEIGAPSASGTGAAIASPSVATGNLVVQTSFRPGIWDSEMNAFDIVELSTWLTSGGVKPAPKWIASFPAHNARNIFTSTDRDTAVKFDWASISSAQQTLLDSLAVSTSAPDSDVLQWLRGNPATEQRLGGNLRSRPNTILADIVNSTPLISKAAHFAYQRAPVASLNSSAPHGYTSYEAHVQTKRTDRHQLVMFGSNGGMFHILDGRIGEATSGQELFAYVPRVLYPKLKNPSNPAYSHQYFVDGPVVEGDVWDGTEWKTFAIGTTGAGGRGMFAIDVSKPQTAGFFTVGGTGLNRVLWDLDGSDTGYEDLGNITQPGYLVSIHDSSAANGQGRWVYIVGNGYESVNNTAALLVIDAFTGQVVKSIQTPAAYNASPNGLGAITPVFDGNRNVVAVYAGDKLGNLWKFKLNDPNKNNWVVANESAPGVKAPLFQAKDSSNVAQPITVAPRVTPHPLGGVYVGFGTGKLFEVGDPADVQVQAVYVLRDESNLAPIAKSDLAEIVLQQFTVDPDSIPNNGDEVTYRKLKDLSPYTPSKKGVFIQLIPEFGTADGERIIASPILDAGVLAVTSYTPTSLGDPCVPGGVSYLYRFDLANRFTQSAFAGQGPMVVGRRVNPGSVGGFAPLYDDVAAGVTIHSMDATQTTNMLKNPKYKMSGSTAVQQGATGVCAHVGLTVDGGFARIPTVCAGLMPIRAWRPLQ